MITQAELAVHAPTIAAKATIYICYELANQNDFKTFEVVQVNSFK
jgi:hypothetical protein